MSDNVNEVIHNLNTAFNEFKATNDANAKRDVLLEEKMTRIESTMTALENQLAESEKKNARPQIDTGADSDAEVKAFNDFARNRMSESEYKALSITGTNEGGVTIPKQIEAGIRSALIDISPIRQIATVISTDGPNYTVPFATSLAGSGWVGEKDARPETSTPTIVGVDVPMGELYANAYATNLMIQDAGFDVGAFLINAAKTKFEKEEGAAFINGNGVNQPKGFLNGTPVATDDASRAFGVLQYVASGTAGALPTTADVYYALVGALKTGYLANAKWVYNRAANVKIKTVKDAAGAYLYAPAQAKGQSNTFMGYDVVFAEDTPGIAANTFPVAIGDFGAGYTIVDRLGVNVLVDPYSAKPHTQFYLTKRTGGCVVDSNAIKLLKLSAS